MKKIIFSLIVSSIFFSCQKNNTEYLFHFYVKATATEGKYSLYIDNSYKGELPYFNLSAGEMPDSLLAKTLQVNLKSGSYKIEGKDASGEVKFLSTLKFKKTARKESMGSSGGKGGFELMEKDGVIVADLF